MIYPTDDRVVIRPDEAETKTAGGLIIPTNAQEAPTRGEVLAVGPGVFNERNGTRLPFASTSDVDDDALPKVGDKVVFSRYGGSEYHDDDWGDVVILAGRDILAVVA